MLDNQLGPGWREEILKQTERQEEGSSHGNEINKRTANENATQEQPAEVIAVPRSVWDKMVRGIQVLTRNQEELHMKYAQVCNDLKKAERRVEALENERALSNNTPQHSQGTYPWGMQSAKTVTTGQPQTRAGRQDEQNMQKLPTVLEVETRTEPERDTRMTDENGEERTENTPQAKPAEQTRRTPHTQHPITEPARH